MELHFSTWKPFSYSEFGFMAQVQMSLLVITDVKHPILHADLLDNFNLLLDLKRKKLVDSTTRQVQGSPSSVPAPSPV